MAPTGTKPPESDVGVDTVVLVSEHPPRPPEAGLHLVADEQRATLVQQPLRVAKEAGRRDVHALALDRLDQVRRDVSLLQLLLESLEIAERHHRVRKQRVEPGAELLRAVDRQRAGGQAVIGVRAVEDAALAGGAAGELQRRLDRFRPAVAEVDALHAGSDRNELLRDQPGQDREVELQHVGEVGVEHVVECSPDDRMVAPDPRDTEAGEEVEVAVAVRVPVVSPLGAGEHPVEPDGVKHLRNLRVDVRRMQGRTVITALLEQRPDVEAHRNLPAWRI